MGSVGDSRALILGISENKSTLVLFTLVIEGPELDVMVYFYRTKDDRRVVVFENGVPSYYDNIPTSLGEDRIALTIGKDVKIILHESVKGRNYRARIIAPRKFEVFRYTQKFSEELPKGEIDVCARADQEKTSNTRTPKKEPQLSC